MIAVWWVDFAWNVTSAAFALMLACIFAMIAWAAVALVVHDVKRRKTIFGDVKEEKKDAGRIQNS